MIPEIKLVLAKKYLCLVKDGGSNFWQNNKYLEAVKTLNDVFFSLCFLFFWYRELLSNFLIRIWVQLISHVIVRRGQRRGRLFLRLGGEGDLRVEQAADDADCQTHKVGPREEVVPSDYHSWKNKTFYSWEVTIERKLNKRTVHNPSVCDTAFSLIFFVSRVGSTEECTKFLHWGVNDSKFMALTKYSKWLSYLDMWSKCFSDIPRSSLSMQSCTACIALSSTSVRKLEVKKSLLSRFF